MFGFWKSKAAPPICSSNPGVGTEVKVAFANEGQSSVEHLDLIALAATVFKKNDLSVVNRKTHFEHPESGFMMIPQIVEAIVLDNGGFRTLTTMQINHSTLAPDGIFEFQHSTGNLASESIQKGFEQWLKTDFEALQDATRPAPKTCMMMEMEFPAKDGRPKRVRRAILGPVMHYMQKPPTPVNGNEDEEHPFCACCLLTRTFMAYKHLIEDDGFYGLRFFAARDENGIAQADCRVNGLDFDDRKAALSEYAATWPEAGYEFRKQYAVFHTVQTNGESQRESE